jgi:hypothetical protein
VAAGYKELSRSTERAVRRVCGEFARCKEEQ